MINFLIQQNFKFEMLAVKNERVKEEMLAFHEGRQDAALKYKFKSRESGIFNEKFTLFIIKD
ncbi:MAG: hypothetical protein ACTSRG_18330 [Candidatus Helarchaeota archaeon]